MEEMNTIDPGDKVAVSIAYKKNLGNYQSMDLYTSVSLTVRGDEGETDTYGRAWEIVERQIEAKLDEVEALVSKAK